MNVSLFAATLSAAMLAAAAAQAHAVLRSANPGPSAVVRTAPTTLKLLFNEAVLPKFTSLAVTGLDGRPLHAGPVTVDPKVKTVVSAPLHGAGAPGVYTVRWTAATSDMHKMSGSYTFTLQP